MDPDTTNLVAGEDTAAATLADDTGVVADDQTVTNDQQFDDAGNPLPEPDEDEEVELDADLKLKVPKTAAEKLRELKEGNLRQADYTRKTQELAELRRATEAERQSVQQASQQEMQAAATVLMIDQQLAGYANVDWAGEMRAARLAYDQDRLDQLHEAKAHFDQLVHQRGGAAQQYGTLVQQRLSTAQQETAKRMEEARSTITREIPDWDKIAPTVLEAAVQHYRFTPEELNGITDPRHAIVLNDARKWREHQAQQKKTANIAAGQAIQPAKTLKGTSAATPVRADTNDFRAFERLMAAKLASN